MTILFIGVFNIVQPRWSEAWEGNTGVLVHEVELVTVSDEGYK